MVCPVKQYAKWCFQASLYLEFVWVKLLFIDSNVFEMFNYVCIALRLKKKYLIAYKNFSMFIEFQ